MDILDRMSSLRVLVIGDTILDEYQYCEVMGKSSKDPVLAVKYQSNDMFAGGVLAVANHVAGFADNVTLVTVLGYRDSHEDFIRSGLRPNISTIFAHQKDAPTLIKRRFVDGYSLNKLFEVYIMDDSGLDRGKEAELCSQVKDQLDEYDVVIAADYGHGAISENLVDLLSKHSKFLAVSVQSNSGNRGFHTISRYPRADYASIAEHEIRLELKARDGVSRAMMEQLSEKLGTSQFVVTRGKKGCLVANNKMEFVDVPAFARNAVDRVGAGDAFFSVTALASALGASNELLGFIGNVAGSLAVGTIGNKKAIDKLSVQKYVVSLMK
jgi:rfaE bifunctional protein kinase chain/domain